MNKFATVINCMDGRVQIPVNEYIRINFGVDFVDTITLPGPNMIFFEQQDNGVLTLIKKWVEYSINKHKSKLLAVVCHHDCAGNPCTKDVQIGHTQKAIELIKSWFNNIEVVGLWVNEDWKVEKLNCVFKKE